MQAARTRINYALTVQTTGGFYKKIQFHSKDEIAPKVLMEIANKIIALTR